VGASSCFARSVVSPSWFLLVIDHGRRHTHRVLMCTEQVDMCLIHAQ
jgi:hypothetical protein